MSDTAADTEAFTDIVAGIVPDVHMVCLICHDLDEIGPGTEAVCGVKLLGKKPLPGAAQCEDCQKAWVPHILDEHLGD